MIPDESWKTRLYSSYVSSGQASVVSTASPATAFRDRRPYINSIIRQHIPRDKRSTIVDIGCGHGTFIYFLRQAGYEDVIGIDTSEEQVAVAKQMGIDGVRHQALAEYLLATPGNSVDVVLLIDVLEHLGRAELFSTLDGVFRILRPTGRLIAHVPNGSGLFGMAIRYGDLTHELAFTKQSAEQLLRTIGFHGVACFEDLPVIHGLKSFARRLGWLLGTVPFRLLYAAESGGTTPIFSQNMLISCEK
jgi:SAM-dependent methyltransferase